MDGIGDFFPSGDLVGVIDSGYIVEAAGGVGDESGFGDEEGAGGGGALGVVGCHHVGGDVGVGGAVAGHGSHGDAVGEVEVAQLEGRE